MVLKNVLTITKQMSVVVLILVLVEDGLEGVLRVFFNIKI